MKVSEIARVRWLLGALLIAAAALFAIGAASEKSGHSEKSGSVESAQHNESGEGANPAESTVTSESSEKVLGLNLESTPLVVVAVAISVALAVATWRSNLKVVLLVAGLFAIAFAVLDIAEFVHQINKSAAGLAALAAIIAVLHAAAAFVANQRRRVVS